MEMPMFATVKLKDAGEGNGRVVTVTTKFLVLDIWDEEYPELARDSLIQDICDAVKLELLEYLEV